MRLRKPCGVKSSALTVSSTASACQQHKHSADGLRDLAVRSGVRIGTAVDVSALDSDSTYRSKVAGEFSSVTAENVMKWEVVEPTRGTYDWSQADELVRRFPESGSGEIRLGSQLVVREGQKAVFFRDGKALDVFSPGRHTLSTNNIPLLTGLLGIPFGGTSPFTAEVYFVSMREFTNLKWGTAQPLVFRDQDFGMVRLRAFGTYSIRVSDPQLLVSQIVGAMPSST